MKKKKAGEKKPKKNLKNLYPNEKISNFAPLKYRKVGGVVWQRFLASQATSCATTD